MELIESYGLTLADINNLIRHAISASDNVHPYNMANQMMDFDETQSRRSNSAKQKDGPRSRQSENGDQRQRFQNQNSFEQQIGTPNREVKVGASVLTEKGNIY
jgi:hypothetical protein